MIDGRLIEKAAGWLDRKSVKPATVPAKLEPTQIQLPPLNAAQQMTVDNAAKNGPLNGPNSQLKFFQQMAENIRTGVGFPQ